MSGRGGAAASAGRGRARGARVAVGLALLGLPPLAPTLAMALPPPVARYGDPVEAPARSALAARVEVAVQALAARTPSASEGPPLALVRDGRLGLALDRLIAQLPPSGPPASALTEQALWLTGVIEPVPYLLTMVVPEGADDDVLPQLARVLPPELQAGRYRRVAVSTAPLPAGGSRLALALQESFVELAPVPRGVALGATVTLSGRVLPPYRAPELFVTGPDGRVSRVQASVRAEASFAGSFSCQRGGTYQVEVAAADRLGDAVLANFPVRCGGAPATEIVAPRPAPGDEGERPWRAATGDVRGEAEAQVLKLLQQDRAAAGLPALTPDGHLQAVARAHSAEMRDRGFFGHLSPTTGSASDRLRRAGVAVLRVRENLGKASSPVELERGLMGSPPHRLNLLSADVDRVGVGVAVGQLDPASGTRDLYLTQLFARLPAPFDPARAEATLRARLAAIRRQGHMKAVRADPALDQVARAVAAGLAHGRADGGDALDRALPELSRRYHSVRKVSGKAVDASELPSTPALLDRAVTHAGFAVAQGPADADGPSPLWLVVLLAAP